MATFGQTLRFLRKQANLTQDDVAKQLNLCKNTVSYYERDEIKDISQEKLKMLNKMFSTDIFTKGEFDVFSKRNDEREPIVIRPTMGTILRDVQSLSNNITQVDFGGINYIPSDNVLLVLSTKLDVESKRELEKLISNFMIDHNCNR